MTTTILDLAPLAPALAQRYAHERQRLEAAVTAQPADRTLRRSLAALNRAWAWLELEPQITVRDLGTDHAVVLVPSSTDPATTYAVNGTCACTAFAHGQPCQHRSVSELILTTWKETRMSTLPTSPAEAEARFYARYGPQGVATWTSVQQLLGRNRPRPTSIDEWIALAEDVRDRLGTPPTTLREAASALTAPFGLDQLAIKPGATTKDKTRALALPYVDLRAYQDRLDAVVGLDGWSVEYRPTANALICRLTILGVTKEDIGEPSGDGDNPATEALAQAFKRACTAFGLGRYLYHLPVVWADYDEVKKAFKDAADTIRTIYKKAGLL